MWMLVWIHTKRTEGVLREYQEMEIIFDSGNLISLIVNNSMYML